MLFRSLASGSDAIVLDVKTGSGALMQETADAEKPADMMITFPFKMPPKNKIINLRNKEIVLDFFIHYITIRGFFE